MSTAGTTTVTSGEAAPSRAPSVLRSGAVMAAGSVVSRATGFVRSAVVAAAIGVGAVADGYAVGNSVPTIVYMLLLGGALNAVFVPELVKAAKGHADGGAAYTDRLLTVCVLALLALTAGAVWAAPAIIDVYTDYPPDQTAMTVAFARYCLPQIFFLGLFTLLGQVLNARGRFGAMMWTPVLNNVVVIAVFGLYLATFATGDGGSLSAAETALLGWGTTAGIAVQALALLPSLRAARFRYRPRFDWRGSGLTRPLRNAGWLVLLVLTNQAAYLVTTRLATSAGLHAQVDGVDGGAGFSAYNNAYLLWAVPHGIITVSLMTALLPRMSAAAADGDTAGIRRDVSYALRNSAAAVVPAACALFALAQPVMVLVFQYGATEADDVAVMAGTLMAFAPGLIAFSGQYVLSRTFYALSDTRTPFLLNLVIAGLNAALSVTAYTLLPARWAVTGIAGAYSLALWAGWAVTALVLHHRLAARDAPGDEGAPRPAPGPSAGTPADGSRTSWDVQGPRPDGEDAPVALRRPPTGLLPKASDGVRASRPGALPSTPGTAGPGGSVDPRVGDGAPGGTAVPGGTAAPGATPRRLVPARTPWRSATLAAQARLLLAAVPTTLLGYVAARWAVPAGAVVAAGTGAAAIAAGFVLLARPLRLAEIDALVSGATARLRRRS